MLYENGKTIDLLPCAQAIIFSYRQAQETRPESGGLLLGYENAITKNYTISSVTEPNIADKRSRCFLRLSMFHRNTLETIAAPYGYIGTWHTHPTSKPHPSGVDLIDWKESLAANHKKTDVLIFIIAGIDELGVWVGNCATGSIIEIKG